MSNQTSLSPNEVEKISEPLREANQAFMRRYPGESDRRQAVHTVYGGAHLFKADSAQRLGAVALRSLEEYAPDAASLAEALGIARRRQLAAEFTIGSSKNCGANRSKISGSISKMATAIDPTRRRTDTPRRSAAEVARGFEDKTLPPFIGIRIKPLNEDLRARSVRTLDIFVTRPDRKRRKASCRKISSSPCPRFSCRNK